MYIIEIVHVFSEILIEHTSKHHLNGHPQPQKKPYFEMAIGPLVSFKSKGMDKPFF